MPLCNIETSPGKRETTRRLSRGVSPISGTRNSADFPIRSASLIILR